MKKFGFLLTSVLTLLACSSPSSFRELDTVLGQEEKYENLFLQQIDSLKGILSRATTDSARFWTARELCERYKVYKIDTSLVYARMMLHNARSQKEEIIARCAQIFLLSNIGEYEQAGDLFNELPKDVPYDDDMSVYYETANHLFTVIGKEKPALADSCQEARRQLRKELFCHDSTSYFSLTYQIYEMVHRQDYEGAVRIATEILQMKDIPLRYRAINEFNLGNNYGRLGKQEEEIKHFIRASVLDLSQSTKEYNALYRLALLLYRQGDYERACRYMLRTMKDALFCNYKSHYSRSANSAYLINNAFIRENSLRKRIMKGLAVTFMALLVLASALAFVMHRYYKRERIFRKRIADANRQLRLFNHQLKDSNLIRDHFLAKYMEISSDYIGKVDEMKSTMRKAYKQDGMDALVRIIRSPSYADKEYRTYYQNFDTTFIGMFPSFVEEVNKLMPEGHKFSPDKNVTLNTELRILALVRLGIIESSRIAKVLNISISTIYSYRYRMRRDALCNADDFEKRISRIGLY